MNYDDNFSSLKKYAREFPLEDRIHGQINTKQSDASRGMFKAVDYMVMGLIAGAMIFFVKTF